MSEKVILVVCMDGYPKHGLHEQVQTMFDAREPGDAWVHSGHGYHQYYYNSEGWQLCYFTNYSIPDSTNEVHVWSHIWDCEDEMEGTEYDEDVHEVQFPKPFEFEVDGQAYKYIGRIHGYNYGSTDPSDDRYEA